MAETEDVRRYAAEVLEVYSGDDLLLLVDIGVDNLFKKTRARLQGVDTPDAYQAGTSSDAGKLRDQVKALLRTKPCIVDVHSVRRGGWIVTLYVKSGPSDENPLCLNEKLIEQGYVYNKGPVNA